MAKSARHTHAMGVDERERTEEAPWEEKPPLSGVAITLAGLVVLGAIVLAVPGLRHGVSQAIGGDTTALRDELQGVDGVLIALGLALVHAVVWYPAEILDTAVGYVHGFALGFPLVMVGWLLNAVAAFWIGHHAARPVLYRMAGRERFERYEALVHRGGVTLLLGMRLIPIVPFSLFSYVAGAARVPLVRFLWTTAVGYIPITAVFVYLGSKLEELSPTDPLLWAGAAVLVVLLLITRRVSRSLGEAHRGPSEPAEGGEPAS
jgi:uncharacterized membrane protein YdjX (TVP38/TMEM64 family)